MACRSKVTSHGHQTPTHFLAPLATEQTKDKRVSAGWVLMKSPQATNPYGLLSTHWFANTRARKLQVQELVS